MTESCLAAKEQDYSKKTKLTDDLLSYALYEDNWDGNGANKTSSDAFENAFIFVWFLESDIPDDSMVCPDGSIVLFWDDGREVEFEKDGRVLKRSKTMASEVRA